MVPANMVSLTEDDIVKVITSFQGQKHKVLLWQKDEQGMKRHIQEARISLVNKEKGEIIFHSEAPFTAMKDTPLYVFDSSRQVVFKAVISDLKPTQMVSQFPLSLMLPNSRLEERMNFFGQKIYLHFSHRQDVKPTDIEDLYKVQVVDVSPNGISFKTTIEKTFGLQKGDRIFIKLYQDDEQLTEGIVKHLTTAKAGSNDQYLQIGVQFQN